MDSDKVYKHGAAVYGEVGKKGEALSTVKWTCIELRERPDILRSRRQSRRIGIDIAFTGW